MGTKGDDEVDDETDNKTDDDDNENREEIDTADMKEHEGKDLKF